MSVRANREELIQKGILLPDPTIGTIQEGILNHISPGIGLYHLALVLLSNRKNTHSYSGGGSWSRNVTSL